MTSFRAIFGFEIIIISSCWSLCCAASNVSSSISVLGENLTVVSPSKSLPLHLKYLIWIPDNASLPHAGGCYPVRDILVELANANKTLLPAYNITMEMFDTKYAMEYNVGTTVRLFMKNIANEAFAHAANSTDVCEGAATASKIDDVCLSALEYGRRAFPLFLGPGYSAEAKVLAQIAPLYNLVQISDSAGAPELSDKTKYPNFYRTILNTDEFVTLPRTLCQYFNISTVFLATFEETYASDPMQKIDSDLHMHNITVLSKSTFSTRRNDTIDSMLTDLLVYDARIIIMWSNEYDEYRIFCRTLDFWAKINVTFSPAKYLVVFMASDDGATELEPETIEFPRCSRRQLAEMLNGSIVTLSPTWGPATDRFDWGLSTTDFISRAEDLGRLQYHHPDGKMMPTIALAIDAIWLSFLTLDSVDKRLRAQRPARTLLDFTFESADIAEMVKAELVKQRFRGATGNVQFNNKSDIIGQIKVQQFRPSLVEVENISSFVDILMFDTANYELTEVEGGKPFVFGTPSGQIPPDKPPPVQPMSSTLYTAIIVAVAAVAVMVCVVLFSGYSIYRRRLLATSMSRPHWLVDFPSLIIRESNMNSRSSLFGLSISPDVRSVDGMTSQAAYLNDQAIRLQRIPGSGQKLSINIDSFKFLTSFHDNMQHSNLVRWIGYSVASNSMEGNTPIPTTSRYSRKSLQSPTHEQYFLWEHCEKGSLEQLIENDEFKLDAAFEFAIMLDVAQGMAFLHKSSTVSNVHGRLCAAACVIDKRFSVKVAGYGDSLLANLVGLKSLREEESVSRCNEKKLYWAPELLRMVPEFTKTDGKTGEKRQTVTAGPVLSDNMQQSIQFADVYAYAVTMHVLLTRAPPYDSSEMDVDQVLRLVRTENMSPPFRPDAAIRPEQVVTNIDKRVQFLLQHAWAEDADKRPPFKEVVRQLQLISGVKANSSVTDQLLQRLERYASDMEMLVAERTQELEAEHRRAEELLNSMLPAEISTELKQHGYVEPESFDAVTIYFSDIVGFTVLSGDSTPIQIINLLNALYTMFDTQIDLFDAYKVETIGDACKSLARFDMVVSGLPRRNGNQHAVEIAKLSLTLLDCIKVFIIPHRPEEKLRLRIGLHTGPCVAGVVGVKMPRYCLCVNEAINRHGWQKLKVFDLHFLLQSFGDTVNTASRMESTGEALRIHVSESAKLAMDLVGGFGVEERGKLEVKGKGTMLTYWLING